MGRPGVSTGPGHHAPNPAAFLAARKRLQLLGYLFRWRKPHAARQGTIAHTELGTCVHDILRGSGSSLMLRVVLWRELRGSMLAVRPAIAFERSSSAAAHRDWTQHFCCL